MNEPEEIENENTDIEVPEADETQEGLARQLVDALCEDAVPKAFKKGKVKGAAGKKSAVAPAPGSVKYGKK